MERLKEQLELEWRQERMNLANQVLVELTQGEEEKMRWVLARVAKSVILKSGSRGTTYTMKSLISFMDRMGDELEL